MSFCVIVGVGMIKILLFYGFGYIWLNIYFLFVFGDVLVWEYEILMWCKIINKLKMCLFKSN